MGSMAPRAGNPGVLCVSSWTPADLGASLYAWWDAARADLITESGGLVSSWKDIVAGYDAAQTVGASKPTYSPTGLGGSFAAVTGDGVDDELTVAGVPSTIPTGALPVSEEWYLLDQQTSATDTVDRVVGSYGGGASSTTRRLRRNVTAGTNRARAVDGTGAGTPNNAVNFTGAHVVRIVANGTTVTVEVDGLAGTGGSLAQGATIGTTRLRFFADALTAASVFCQCAIAARLFTGLLSGDDASRLYAYLNRRK